MDGLVEAPASDARVDGDRRGETGVDVEVHRLRPGLVGEDVVRCAGRLGVEAQGAADHIARADRQVDLPDTLCPYLAGDVLRGVDGHLGVDVEESEVDEGMEVGPRASAVTAFLAAAAVPGRGSRWSKLR